MSGDPCEPLSPSMIALAKEIADARADALEREAKELRASPPYDFSIPATDDRYPKFARFLARAGWGRVGDTIRLEWDGCKPGWRVHTASAEGYLRLDGAELKAAWSAEFG